MNAPGSEPSKRRRQPLLWPAIGTPLYLGANFAAIRLPFIPGLDVFFGWGFLLPLGAIITIWIWLFRNRAQLRLWYGFAVGFTIIFIFAGGATLWIIGQIWASV